jgi:hypothetical protein
MTPIDQIIEHCNNANSFVVVVNADIEDVGSQLEATGGGMLVVDPTVKNHTMIIRDSNVVFLTAPNPDALMIRMTSLSPSMVWLVGGGDDMAKAAKIQLGRRRDFPSDKFIFLHTNINPAVARPPYQQRVIDEKRDLDEKIAKLDAFLNSRDIKKVDGDERWRLECQIKVMRQYANILETRIKSFR